MNKTAHQVISEIALYGPSEKESKLEYESSDYLCLACSLTPYGTVNSEVASVEFATGKVSPSDNQIEIVLEQLLLMLYLSTLPQQIPILMRYL